MTLLRKLVWFFFVAMLLLTTEIRLTSVEVIPVGIGLYWDEESSMVVSSVDFGTVARGRSKSVTFWLRHESTDKHRIIWKLDNFSPSSHGIIGSLERRNGKSGYVSNWNKKLKPGDLWEVRYTVELAQDVEIGVYSWDITVNYVVSNKIHCLSLTCVLFVAK